MDDWIKLAVSYFLDEKVVQWNDAEEVMFIRGLAYAGLQKTGGFIPAGALLMLGRKGHQKSAETLVASGVWLAVEGGWRVTRWSGWQSQLDELAAKRKKDADRKRAEREAKKAVPVQRTSNGQSSDIGPDSADSPQDVTPDLSYLLETREEIKESTYKDFDHHHHVGTARGKNDDERLKKIIAGQVAAKAMP